jgi:hypothetical protein
MTPDETRKVLAYCVTVLPSLRLPDEPQLSRVVAAWTDLLGDLPYPVVQHAVRAVLATQEGPWWPTPGAIRQAAARLTHPPIPAGDEAWGLVRRAVARWGYMAPREAVASLPPPVQAVVRAIGWEALCAGDADVLRGQFGRLYEVARARAARAAGLPPALQDGALAGRTPARPGDPAEATGGPADPLLLGALLEAMRRAAEAPGRGGAADRPEGGAARALAPPRREA